MVTNVCFRFMLRTALIHVYWSSRTTFPSSTAPGHPPTAPTVRDRSQVSLYFSVPVRSSLVKCDPKRFLSSSERSHLVSRRLRAVPEAGGRDPALRQALHHGREAGPAELRPVRLAGETGAADQEVPADGGDRLPGARHEGELTFSRSEVCRGSPLVWFCPST